MKYFVFFLTFASLSAGVLLVHLPPALAINYNAQNAGVGRTAAVRAQPRVVGVGKTLGGPNLTSCLARQTAIKGQMTALINLTVRMEKQFDLIAQRSVDYYNRSVVPNGKTVSNYDALITDIQTKKETIQSALTIVQTDSNNFSCTSDDPKLLMSQFRLNMQLVKINLRNYRTSIKNLITAIRSASPESVNKVEKNQ